MSVTPLADHPIAGIFPLLPVEELTAMADDIKANGLKQDIVLYEGKILDGRNRYRACQLAGVQIKTHAYIGDDPVGHVLSLNRFRRHMTARQLACVATDSLPFFEEEAQKRREQTQGRPSKLEAKMPQVSREPQARDRAAEAVGVSPRYVSDAKKIKEASPETFEKLKSGEVSMAEAKEAIKPPTFTPPSVAPSQAMVKAKQAINIIATIPTTDRLLPDAIKAIREYLDRKETQINEK